MRRLRRPPVSLPTLVEIQQQYPLTPRGIAPGVPTGRWNNPDVRGGVYAMNGRICAYCQRPASDARGDVEHFRPKSTYPWLMYEFMNYLLGCRVCNTNRKSDRFPLAPRAKPVGFKERMRTDRDFLQKALAKEKRLLIDPVEDPIEDWVDIDFKNPLCPIILTAAATGDQTAKDRVSQTIEFFGLNTLPELLEDRMKRIDDALKALDGWREGDAAMTEALRILCSKYTPHGWAVRRVVRQLAPDFPFPTDEEELRWFVEDTLAQLERIELILAGNPPDKDREMIAARKAEASWTLAVLWKEPPAASSSVVETWITNRGKRAAIDALTTRL